MGIEETREKIVSVADRLFSRFGFHKTSMDEIAKTSRKAKGSLYYHFASKEVLFREVVTKEVNQLKASLSAIVGSSDYTAGGKLKNYMITRMSVLNSATNYHEIIRSETYDHFEFVDDIRKELDEWERNQIDLVLQEGKEKGEFHLDVDIRVMSDMLIMMIKGLEIPFFIHGRYVEYAPYFDDLSKVILKGLKE